MFLLIRFLHVLLFFFYHSQAVNLHNNLPVNPVDNHRNNQHDNLPHGPRVVLPTLPVNQHDSLHDSPQGTTSYQPILSTHLINHPINTSYQQTLSTHQSLLILVFPLSS